ncbi:MAG: C1 family peptidase [bacterium]
MPSCFDWRNFNGVNYEGPVRQQGDCGSCYSVAAISSLEARIRI